MDCGKLKFGYKVILGKIWCVIRYVNVFVFRKGKKNGECVSILFFYVYS